jgi:hypothetical protein
MRYRAHAVLGVAFVFSAIAGCGVTRHPTSDPQVWSWQNRDARTPQQRPYGLSVSPYESSPSSRNQPRAKTAQFDFSHPRVDSYVERFQTSLRRFFSAALSRSGRYVARMSSILEKEGVPQELAYLPLIESGFRPHAVSRAGAVGPWQFISGTGRRYGLRIDRYVDERRDPVKSTYAAARYLKDLHDTFGDWQLSLAAYNTGEQNISRILERRRVEDFWEMSERGYLYQETRDFVPRFLAAVQIAEMPEAYGFDAPDDAPPRYDLVTIDRPLALSTVAQLSGSSTSELRELNPALRRDMVPPDGYAVRLPKGTKETFQVAYANMGRFVPAAEGRTPHRPRGRHKHRSRRGTTVASIAEPGNGWASAWLDAPGSLPGPWARVARTGSEVPWLPHGYGPPLVN